MHSISKDFVLAAMSGLFALAAANPAYSQLDGALPIPILKNVRVDAAVSYDTAPGTYQYRYTVANPATNTGIINRFYVDILSAGPAYGDANALTIEFRRGSSTFQSEINRVGFEGAPTMVPVGIAGPAGWDGSIWARGGAAFETRGPTRSSGDSIPPGQSRSGFTLNSFTTPTIREMALIPDWIYVSTSPDGISDEESRRAAEIEVSLPDHVFTLGPSWVFPGSYEHWNDFRDSLARAVSLGWVSDPALAQSLTTQLASARAALAAREGTLAKSRLQQLLTTLAASNATQRRSEVNDLVSLNAQSLIVATPDTPVPFEPKVSFSPESTTLPIGATYTLTALAMNLGDDRPLADFPVEFRLFEGPHAPRAAALRSGTDGNARFSYTGTAVGRDRIAVSVPGDFHMEVGVAEVIWTAGPDLAVPLFTPPVLRSRGGNDAVIHDVTANISTEAASPPSVTRYYLGDTSPVDITLAVLLGERSIPALAPGELNHSPDVHVQLPATLPEGTHYLAACADAPESVVELDESNNCSFSPVEGFMSVVVPIEPGGAGNQPPVCAQAVAEPGSLWPPNHKLRVVEITGVTDPDGDHVSLSIASITQDEPVNGLGDGDTAPDGFGVGTTMAQLRAERSGTGNGRVYRIAFTGDDGKGGTCQGTVGSGVPHDQGQGSQPIDDGQFYDSAGL